MTVETTGIGSALSRAGGSEHSSAKYTLLRLTGSVAACLWATTAMTQALPTGGNVAAGNVTITQPNNTQLQINQGSDTAIVNWNGFSIGKGARVDINQPGARSVILNRVTGNTTSEIHGQLNANGQVHLVNPNGIFIGANGVVSTGGFVASTLGISDDDFLAGRYRYRGDGSSAAVENAGTISIARGGYAALIGGRVSNSGLIRVPLGKVGLGAGEKVTLDVSGDGFLQVAVPSDSDDSTMEALVENSGRIEANGGLVHLKAAAARDAARQVVNMSGVIEARSVGGRSGAVVLGGSGGAVHVSGRINASAPAVTQSPRPAARPGGDITITGTRITLEGATLDVSGAGAGDGGSIRVGGDYQGTGNLQRALQTFVDAGSTLIADGGSTGDGGRIIVWSDVYTEFHGDISARGGDQGGDGGFAEVSGKIDLLYRGLADLRAPKGETGTLLLDPTNVTIDAAAAATLVANLATSNVIVDTSASGPDDGNITVNADIDWNSAFNLTLSADNAITINNAINAPNGGLILAAFGAVDGVGRITTGAGGSINVGLFSLSAGFWDQVSGTLPSFFASDFDIDPDANFLRALGGDGSAGNPYQLTDIYGVQGLNSPALFGASFELANNIDASITSSWSGGFEPIDFFAGTLDGLRHVINGLFIDQGANTGGMFRFIDADGEVFEMQLTNADVRVGGGGILAAFNDGKIAGVAVSGSIVAEDNSGGAFAGGLVGANGSSGSIIDSFSTASVEVILPVDVSFDDLTAGGLVAENTGVIERSHSTGSVTLTDETGSGFLVGGGLVGVNFAEITDSYSTSSVTANDGTVILGGLVGINDTDPDFVSSGVITNTFSTGSVSYTGSGSSTLGGLVGFNGTTVTASFWDTQTSGQSTSAGGTGLTTAQMQDTQGFYDRALAAGWDFSTVWAPGSSGFYAANYTTSPVVFAIPDSTVAVEGQLGSATTTGTVAGGPSLYRFGPDPDSLDTSPIFGSLTFASQSPGTTTFTVDTSNLTSSGGQSYRVVALEGTADILPAPVVPVTPPTIPPIPVVNITPTIDTTIDDDTGGGTAVNPVDDAKNTLGTVENLSEDFEQEVASCGSEGQDVSKYLACLADAMDTYAGDLDAIASDLPPGLEEIGDIIRDASAQVRAAGEEANRRLALATTAEERAAIRQAAVTQARTSIQTAQSEIRKAITLIRATDPELVSVQRQQVETVVAAVGSAEIGLSRAIGL